MPKNDKEKTGAFKSYLLKRSDNMTPRNYLAKQLEISHATATKFIHDPTLIRLKDYIRLGFNPEEMEALMK